METAHAAHKAPNYYLIWFILLILTVAEVGVAFGLHANKTFLIVSLLILAVWKALLVAMYYMHLKWEPKKLWVIVAAPIPLIIILLTAVLSEGF
jgi:cytochrome c oxidase subunit 4